MAGVVLAVDIATKELMIGLLGGSQPPIEVVDGVLTLVLVRNSGAAFGIGTGLTAVFTVVAIIVVVAIVRISMKVRCVPWAVALGLLLGGATGNLVDRLLRPPAPFRGHVVDWIQLPYWPVFNIADSAIVCGGILMVILAARRLDLDGTRVPRS